MNTRQWSSGVTGYHVNSQDERAWITRVKVMHDRLHVVTPGGQHVHIIPFEDLNVWEDSALGRHLWHKRFQTIRDWNQVHCLDIASLFKDDPRVEKAKSDWDFYHGMVFDVLPMRNERWFQRFELAGKKMKVSTKWHPSPFDGSYKNKDDEPPKEQIIDRREVDCPFEGYFTVYGQEDDYYFLTDSGKLYSLPTDPKKDTMVEVWNDPKRRLMGAIQHVDKKTVYAIVRGGKDGERAWFELSAKPELHEYTRTAESLKANPRRNEVPDAWATIAAHLKKQEPAKK